MASGTSGGISVQPVVQPVADPGFVEVGMEVGDGDAK